MKFRTFTSAIRRYRYLLVKPKPQTWYAELKLYQVLNAKTQQGAADFLQVSRTRIGHYQEEIARRLLHHSRRKYLLKEDRAIIKEYLEG